MSANRIPSPASRGAAPRRVAPGRPDHAGPPREPDHGAGSRIEPSATPPSGSHSELPPLRKAALLVVSLDENHAAQLLAQLDRAAVEAVTLEMARLDSIEPADQRAVLEEFLALGLRRRRFLFDDIVRLADRDIRAAFDDEDAATWTLALAGAPRSLQKKVLAALRADTARDLERRLTLLGPFRLDDAESAQADLAERLKRLHDLGEISLPDPEANDDIIV